MSWLTHDIIKIGGWFYRRPDLTPNEEGEQILVFQYSVGPVEYYKWGIDKDGNCFEEYKWLENDFYSDENYRKEITLEKLTNVVDNLMKLSDEFMEWKDEYSKILAKTE